MKKLVVIMMAIFITIGAISSMADCKCRDIYVENNDFSEELNEELRYSLIAAGIYHRYNMSVELEDVSKEVKKAHPLSDKLWNDVLKEAHKEIIKSGNYFEYELE